VQANEAQENKEAAGAEGKYNDPTFAQILKNGQSLEHNTSHEALYHMEHLIEDGVDIDSKDKHGMTALHYNYKQKDVVDFLISEGADIDARGTKGRTCLHLLCLEYGEKIEEIEKLLNMNADPNVQDDNGMTPLLVCCEMHNKSISGVKGARIRSIRHLLNSHADPGITSHEGNAIHHALWGGVGDCTDPMGPDGKPDTEWYDNQGGTPRILKTLMQTDPDCVNVGNFGEMIDHRAALDRNTPLQRLCIMDSSAHPSYGTPDGLAVKRMVEYMVLHKADYRSPDGEGVPPRRRAASKELRALFNNASKISMPGTPARF